MAENKDTQPFNPQQGKGMTGNDGSKGNFQKMPSDNLGSVEEIQQNATSDENHNQQGKTGQGAVKNEDSSKADE